MADWIRQCVVKGTCINLVVQAKERAEVSAVAWQWKISNDGSLGLVDCVPICIQCVAAELNFRSKDELVGTEGDAMLPGTHQHITDMSDKSGEIVIIHQVIIHGLHKIGEAGKSGVSTEIELVAS